MKRQQNSFNAGELSPLLSARNDLEKYPNGCSELTNFTVIAQGGLTRRPGTVNVRTNTYALVGVESFLLPFVFSEEISYLLEVMPSEFFVMDSDGEFITVEDSIWEASINSQSGTFEDSDKCNVYSDSDYQTLVGYCSTTASGGTLSSVNFGKDGFFPTPPGGLTGFGYGGQNQSVGGTVYLVTDNGSASAELNIDEIEDGVYKFRHSLQTNNETDFQYSQSADVIFIATGVDKPSKISRYGETDWRFETLAISNIPFEAQNINKSLQLQISLDDWANATDYIEGDCIKKSTLETPVSILDASTTSVGRKINPKWSDSAESVAFSTNVGVSKYIDDPDTTQIKIDDADIVFKTGEVVTIVNGGSYTGTHVVKSVGFESQNVVQIDTPFTSVTFGPTSTIAKGSVRKMRCVRKHTSDTAADPDPFGSSGPPLYLPVNLNPYDWKEIKIGITGLDVNISGDALADMYVGQVIQVSWPKIVNYIDQDSDALEPISVLGAWKFTTHGTWTGTVDIERSFDNGDTWEKYRSYVSASDTNVIVNDLSEDIRVLLRVNDSGITSGTIEWDLYTFEAYDTGTFVITEKTTSTTGKCDILSPLPSLDSSYRWSISSWNDQYGYPEFVTFYSERLIYASNTLKPNTFWMSEINNYTSFKTGTLDTDAIEVTLSSERLDKIQWLVAHKDLVMGTMENEWVINSRDTDKVLTPSTIQARVHTNYGGKKVRASIVNDVVLFIQKYGGKLREFTYTYEKDGYTSPELTVLAEHILKAGVVSIHLQKTPTQKIWCVLEDGSLAILEYDRLQNIIAWSTMNIKTTKFIDSPFPIPNFDGNTDVKSLAIVPKSGYDQVFFLVKTPGVSGKNIYRCIVYDDLYSTVINSEQTYHAYLDGIYIMSGTEGDILEDGTSKYILRPVDSIAPNHPVTLVSVASGEDVIYEMPASEHTSDTRLYLPDDWELTNTILYIGTPYESKVIPMLLEESQAGVTIDKRKRIFKSSTRVYKSGLFEVGAYSRYDEVILKNEDGTAYADDYGFDGDIELFPPVGYHNNIALEIKTSKSTALNLLSLTYDYTMHK